MEKEKANEKTKNDNLLLLSNEWKDIELKHSVMLLEKEFLSVIQKVSNYEEFLTALLERKVLVTLDADNGAVMAVDKWNNTYLIASNERLITAVSKMISHATEGDKDYKFYTTFLNLLLKK